MDDFVLNVRIKASAEDYPFIRWRGRKFHTPIVVCGLNKTLIRNDSLSPLHRRVPGWAGACDTATGDPVAFLRRSDSSRQFCAGMGTVIAERFELELRRHGLASDIAE
jgi:hypothetical protein